MAQHAFYRHDTFVYRTPAPNPEATLDVAAMREMEIWTGSEWRPVPKGDQVLVMFEGGPITAGEAAAETGESE